MSKAVKAKTKKAESVFKKLPKLKLKKVTKKVTKKTIEAAKKPVKRTPKLDGYVVEDINHFASRLDAMAETDTIYAFKYVDGLGYNPIHCLPHNQKYEVDGTYFVTNASYNKNRDCDVGLNVATKQWCLKDGNPAYHLLVVRFTKADMVVIPINTGGKFRVKQFTVVKRIPFKKVRGQSNAELCRSKVKATAGKTWDVSR